MLADAYPDPWLRISEIDASTDGVRFGQGVSLPYQPFPGTIGVAPPESGQHPIVPPRRWSAGAVPGPRPPRGLRDPLRSGRFAHSRVVDAPIGWSARFCPSTYSSTTNRGAASV